MQFSLCFDIECEDESSANLLRDELAATLGEQCTHASATQRAHSFEVVGVDTEPETPEPFSETVEAPTADDARDAVETDTKLVADVRLAS
jgi:hypothetical protein